MQGMTCRPSTACGSAPGMVCSRALPGARAHQEAERLHTHTGSERVGRSEATGDRLEEAKHINRSLSALGDVMAALASKARAHVPFRNSKLTQLLQDSLCGQAKAMMFIHIAPEVGAPWYRCATHLQGPAHRGKGLHAPAWAAGCRHAVEQPSMKACLHPGNGLGPRARPLMVSVPTATA